MLLRDVLARKETRVFSVKPGTSIREAVETMVSNKIGAILVYNPETFPLVDCGGSNEFVATSDNKPLDTTDHSHLIGIFTERDNLRATADRSIPLDGSTVEKIMTRDIVCAKPGDSVHAGMSLMTEKRIRHLPVVSDGMIIGIVSIGDLVKAILDAQEAEIQHMKSYIQGT